VIKHFLAHHIVFERDHSTAEPNLKNPFNTPRPAKERLGLTPSRQA